MKLIRIINPAPINIHEVGRLGPVCAHPCPVTLLASRGSRTRLPERRLLAEHQAASDEKTNIFRFQDHAKNPVQSLARVLRRIGVAAPSAQAVRVREKMRREAGQSTMGDPIRSETRPGETRPDEDLPRRRRRALNCPKRQFFSLCYLVTVVSTSTIAYGEVFRTRAA